MIKKIIIIFCILAIFLSCSSSILDDPTTTINFSVPQNAYVKLTVENSYDTLISTLINKEMTAGQHSVVFNTANLAEGVYYYTLEIKGLSSSNYYRVTRNLVLVK